jgi:serine/threonine protein kinase
VRQPVPFGKYLLLDRISVGGMAEVFKAKSYGVEGFEKIIAIKRILPTMGEDRDFIKMFIDEAKIAGQLAHANICQIFELGRIDGSHFIAMEYIWGKDLLQIQNRLRKLKQGMPVAMACFTIAKVLEGLDYAHRKRDPLGRPLEIVHRDCSPQNVLVSYEGEVKVIDFGIAKATSRNSRTMAGVLKGKFGYMSPEQVRGLPLDRRSDLFALGTMLYECLTSERLFQGETDFSTLEKVRNVDIQRPREVNPEIPEAVERVILKALAKDVDDRYQWCSEMLADLQQFLMAQEVVLTAKSLSSWLKEVFAAEIERERQQLEQYKRVGRDGLIAGVPAAEAKLDVVESLGAAGPAEGDPTMLGEPSFDDLEQAVAAGAAPEVGPAPGSPAARGRGDGGGRAIRSDDDEGPVDFGEEAPTEIFGEIDSATAPPAGAAAVAARAATAPPKAPPRAPTARAATAGREGAPPSAGAPMQTPAGPIAPPRAPAPPSAATEPTAAAPPLSGAAMPPYPGAAPSPGAPLPAAAAPPPATPFGQGKTLLGAAPMGVPSYAPAGPTGQLPAQGAGAPPYGAYPQYATPGQVPAQGGYPAYGAPGQGPLGLQPGPGGPVGPGGYAQHAPSGFSGPGPFGGHGGPGAVPAASQPPHPAYPAYAAPYGTAGNAVEPGMPAAGSRRSSIGRDIAIGVAIAALVLGGFLALKLLVLDSDDEQPPAEQAKLTISIPSSARAQVFLDGARLATVADGDEVSVPTGPHEVRLAIVGGVECTRKVDLGRGQSERIACAEAPVAPGDGSARSGPPGAGSDDVGSAATAPAGSAAIGSGGSAAGGAEVAAGPGAGTGEAAASAADPGAAAGADKAAADKAAADKAAADKAAADKAAADKAAADKAATDKAAADKASADKAAADKAAAAKKAAEKAAADKAAAAKKASADRTRVTPPDKARPKDRLPPEDNPADRALAMPAHGWLVVTSRPPAKVLIDGRDSGLTTPVTGRRLPLTPGTRRLTLVVGGDTWGFDIVIKAGEAVVLDKLLR